MDAKIIVYEKPTCTTCRNLTRLFVENGVDCRKINYFVERLTEEKLRDLLRKTNLTAFEFLRIKEPIFRQLNLTAQTATDEIIKAIIENPALLQRPIVEVGERAVVARPIEKAIDLINADK